MTTKTALIVGATGLIGGYCLHGAGVYFDFVTEFSSEI